MNLSHLNITAQYNGLSGIFGTHAYSYSYILLLYDDRMHANNSIETYCMDKQKLSVTVVFEAIGCLEMTGKLRFAAAWLMTAEASDILVIMISQSFHSPRRLFPSTRHYYEI